MHRSELPAQSSGQTCVASLCTVGIPQGGVTGYKDVPVENVLEGAVTQQPDLIATEAVLMSIKLAVEEV